MFKFISSCLLIRKKKKSGKQVIYLERPYLNCGSIMVHIFPISFQVNTFQAALIFNNRMSFVFFFYDQIVEGFRNISAGFSPSSQSFNANTAIPFNIPGVFTNETDLASDSNTGLSGVTGLYAFRTDHPFIVEPRGTLK